MKLSYRGVSYESEPSILEMNQGEMGGKYRGQQWQYRYPKHIPQVQPKLYMQYRGVTYSTRSVPRTVNSPVAQSELTGTFCPVPVKKDYQVFRNEMAKTHLENIRRNLERRLQVAKESGNDNLVNLLEKESEQLAMNI